MPMMTEASSLELSSKPMKVSGVFTAQSAGTSNAVPHLGLMTTFQPSMVGFSSSPLRGLSSEVAVGLADLETDDVGDFDGPPPPASSSLSPPRTRTPVTPAAITTAEAATIAVIFVLFPPPPPPEPPVD